MRRTRFSPQAKILAEGRLCRPEHFDPEGRSGPLAKHYNPDISNFRFAILISCPTALLGRAAFAAYERFAEGKTSAEGWLCHPEHLNHRRAERALGPRSPKRKTRYKRVFLFERAEHFRRHGVNRCSPMGCGFSVFLESLCYLPLITRELIDFLADVPSFQCEYHQNNKLISPNRRSLEKMTL